MAKRKLKRCELCEQLNEQLDRLRQYTEIYDSGDYTIAKEMAIKLRVIFHNTPNSHSLVKQLKFHNKNYLDTGSKYDPKNLVTFMGLLMIHVENGKTKLIPKLDSKEGVYVNFDNWWKNKKIIEDKHQKSFTRWKIIREVVNKDGGAHVDPNIDIDYEELSKNNSIGWEIFDGIKSNPVNNPVFPCIRQIVFETLETFKNIKIV